jgi:hypothetical protein
VVFDDSDDIGGGIGWSRGRADNQIIKMTGYDEKLNSIPRVNMWDEYR